MSFLQDRNRPARLRKQPVAKPCTVSGFSFLEVIIATALVAILGYTLIRIATWSVRIRQDEASLQELPLAVETFLARYRVFSDGAVTNSEPSLLQWDVLPAKEVRSDSGQYPPGWRVWVFVRPSATDQRFPVTTVLDR